MPVTVEYSITPLGRTLAATVDGLRIWAETHIDKVLKAQKQSDASAQRATA
jgi:DNA-binding HxlR family transcriptional regulator